MAMIMMEAVLDIISQSRHPLLSLSMHSRDAFHIALYRAASHKRLATILRRNFEIFVIIYKGNEIHRLDRTEYQTRMQQMHAMQCSFSSND